MSSIMSPQEMIQNSARINAENVIRVRKYLGAALQEVVLAPGQLRVEKLFLVHAKESDHDLILFLMKEAGYATVTVIERRAEYNTTDTVMSFTIPSQSK